MTKCTLIDDDPQPRGNACRRCEPCLFAIDILGRQSCLGFIHLTVVSFGHQLVLRHA